jgi:hypothetical protein
VSLKQWRGISHQIDDPLRVLAKQSLDRLKNGEEDVDLARRQMIAARIEAAKAVMPVTTEEQQARMPFRSKEQQILLRKRSRLEAALRETTAGQGMTLTQLACMHDLGLTTPLRLPLQDKEILVDTPLWRALLRAEIQHIKNKLDKIAKKQTRKCEIQAKQREAREYMRDKKGPSKFCGKMQSPMSRDQPVYDMPSGVLLINQGETGSNNGILKKIRDAIPTAEILRSTDTAVAILILTISEATIGDGDAWIARAQMAWKWKTALQTPQRFLEIIRNLLFQKKENNPGDFIVGVTPQEAVDILWAGQGAN